MRTIAELEAEIAALGIAAIGLAGERDEAKAELARVEAIKEDMREMLNRATEGIGRQAEALMRIGAENARLHERAEAAESSLTRVEGEREAWHRIARGMLRVVIDSKVSATVEYEGNEIEYIAAVCRAAESSLAVARLEGAQKGEILRELVDAHGLVDGDCDYCDANMHAGNHGADCPYAAACRALTLAPGPDVLEAIRALALFADCNADPIGSPVTRAALTTLRTAFPGLLP